MNRLTKFYLTAILSLSFALAPIHAAQTKSLGMILDSQGGHIGATTVTAGSSVYVGDILSTDTDGSLTVRIGQTTYQLQGDTSAVFFPGQSSPIAELRRGTIVVSNNSASEGFEIFASDVRIVSGTARPIQGQVSLKSPCELVVSSQEGLIDVVAGSEKKTVDHDHAYRVIPEHSVDKTRDAISPEDPNYHQNHTHTGCAAALAHATKGPILAGNSHFTELALSAAGVIIIVSIIKAYESPDRP
jgi:hypothetical protein